MKINSGWRSFGQKVQMQESAGAPKTRPKSFSDFMQQQDGGASREQLNRYLQQIEDQGNRLIRSMTVRELREYKRLVQQFLETAIRGGIALQTKRGIDRRGRGRKYKLVEEIDRRLLELTDDLLQREQGRIQLLDHVGEIKGMLVNLLY